MKSITSTAAAPILMLLAAARIEAATIVVGTTPPFADPTATTRPLDYVDSDTLTVTQAVSIIGLTEALTDIAYEPKPV